MFEYEWASKSLITTVLRGDTEEEFGFSVSLSGRSLVVGAPGALMGSGEA